MRHFLSMEGPVYRILTRFVELIVLNGLFLLFCIPIFTIGASTTALYSVTLKMVRNEESGVYSGFVQAFKKNFKQSTSIWIMFLFAGIILFLDFLYLEVYEGNFTLLIILSLIIFTCIYLLLTILIFPYVARFKNTIRESMVNAMKIAITNPFQTIPVLIFSIGPVLLIFFSPYLFLLTLYLSLFLGFSLVAYLNSFLLRNIYEKY
ncbi:Predicted integral membrane protein [Mycobacteroides abscessus subsp. abscessus]|nr:Predicted integral membrane protein [Mycobacteroides abscessus subsp. abscessus]